MCPFFRKRVHSVPSTFSALFRLHNPPFVSIIRLFPQTFSLILSNDFLRLHEISILINFPGASTQTPQGRLPPASQERGISPNLATLGASLYAPRGGECTHSHSIKKSSFLTRFCLYPNLPERSQAFYCSFLFPV